ncbi:Uu.00g092700.m01.CDS01 [Anthostomella pinea]|uniref:Mitochondrial import inner membrane translocase subunit TIM50 n=1 Tax=Anthostomella pinea TaxID=933095 RepID=A0AAI8YI37_9PEZI|nr:Uu.00g092700.m01.CDS01 [Anthostomella pinea]
MSAGDFGYPGYQPVRNGPYTPITNFFPYQQQPQPQLQPQAQYGFDAMGRYNLRSSQAHTALPQNTPANTPPNPYFNTPPNATPFGAGIPHHPTPTPFASGIFPSSSHEKSALPQNPPPNNVPPSSGVSPALLQETSTELARSGAPEHYSPIRRSPVRQFRARDQIVAPSKESGGVPDPTALYLAHASYPPLLLPRPRNILVVIDLNGTLLYRPNKRQPSTFIMRPYAREFLNYCIRTFTVTIWSSARPDNVENMCKTLLTPELRAKVVAVWGRDRFGLSTSDYNSRVQCYKRLSVLWNSPLVSCTHPDAKKGVTWSQKDTVLVDDSLEKARTEPYNLIQVPDFEGYSNEPAYVLPQVHNYINECSQQADISTYMRATPFKLRDDFVLH